MDRVCGIGWRAAGPEGRVPMDADGDEIDQRIGRDGDLFAVPKGQRLSLVLGRGFGNADDGRNEPQLFGQDGTGHAAEEFRQVAVVVPLAGRFPGEDLVEVGLEGALGGGVEGEEEDGEMDGVGGRFMAGEDEDKGVAHDFVVGQELFGGSGAFGGERFGGETGASGQSAHQVHTALAFVARGDLGLFRLEHLVHVHSPFHPCRIG